VNLDRLQQELELVYDASIPHRVDDFLLGNPELARALAPHQDSPEQLLLRQHEDGLDISLYLHQQVLARLANDDPVELLHSGNLADYWLVVEGVSHFLHLVWHAGYDRQVTCLELELLAEIDKFVSAAVRVQQQTGVSHSKDLQRRLFQEFEFRDGMNETSRQRYYEANRLAARYCCSLTRRFELASNNRALIRELRRFQRLPKGDKIQFIRGA
jgi:hypothetical protein